MDPRTIQLLYDNIEKDYNWRIIELSNFRSGVISENNQNILNSLVRAGVALLYSHWEGFVKYCSDQYYQFVSFQALKTGQLSDSFMAIVLRGEIEQLVSSKKITIHSKVIQLFMDEMKNEAKFSSNSPIKTSNLNYAVFEDICTMIGINLVEFERIYHHKGFDRNLKLTIDEDLVNKRNHIAHGQRLLIDKAEFQTLYRVVVNGFLHIFKEQIMTCAQNKAYTRSTIVI